MIELIDARGARPVPPPTAAELRAMLRDARTKLASWDRRLVELAELLTVARECERQHRAEVESLRQLQYALASGPLSTFNGEPYSGLPDEARPRWRELALRIDLAESRFALWIAEADFVRLDGHGREILRSTRRVGDLEAWHVESTRARALAEQEVRDVAARLARAGG